MTFEEFKTRSRIKAHELIMAHDLEAENLAMINRAAENAKFDILGWIKNKIHMTITRNEIKDDFYRFIRHEAMRANTSQDVIKRLIFDKYLLPVSRQKWNGVKVIDIYTGRLENINTTIPKEQINDDVARFVRHEAMRANTLQHEIRMMILLHVYLYWLIESE